MLLFPRGRVEPDPAFLPGALESMGAWSPSLEIFLRQVPQTQVLVTIVSGVFSPVFLHNPLVRLWPDNRDPLMIAEATQVAAQILLRKKVRIIPRVSFDLPKTVSDLYQSGTNLYASVLSDAIRLLVHHLMLDFELKENQSYLLLS